MAVKEMTLKKCPCCGRELDVAAIGPWVRDSAGEVVGCFGGMFYSVGMGIIGEVCKGKLTKDDFEYRDGTIYLKGGKE